MAAHYDTAILPARPRRPRDKAKVCQFASNRDPLFASNLDPSEAVGFGLSM
jgi:hypothetical protein